MVEVMTFRSRAGVRGLLVLGAVVSTLLTGCSGQSAADSGAAPAALCSVARERAAHLPLGAGGTLPTSSPEELRSGLESASAAYAAMAEVATPEFLETLDQVQQGLGVLNAEFARTGYDWNQIDMTALSAVFTPEFDEALRALTAYLEETCQISLVLPTL
jgi:hypothetical protein